MRHFFQFASEITRKYAKSSVVLLFPQILGAGLQLFTLPFFVSHLSPDDFGLWQFTQAILLAFTIFSCSHVSQGSKRGLGQNKNGTIWYASIFRFKWIAVLSFLGFVLASIFWIREQETLSILTCVISGFLLLGFLPQVTFPEIFIAKREFGRYAFFQSLVFIFSQVVPLLALFITPNIIWIVLSQYLTLALLSLLACVMAFIRHHVFASYKKGEIDKDVIPYGKKLVPAEIIQGIAGSLHNFIIGPFFGFANLAVFSVAGKLDGLFRTTVSSLYHVLYADFVAVDRAHLVQVLKKKLFFLVLGACIISAGLLALAVVYIQTFLPIDYGQAVWYMSILALGLPAVLVQIIFQTALETRLESENLRRATFISQGIRIALVFLGGFFGVFGVCFAIALSSWVGSIVYGSIFFSANKARE